MKKRTSISLRCAKNRSFLEGNQGSIVTGAIMPNGYIVPKAPKGLAWRVRGRKVVLESAKVS